MTKVLRTDTKTIRIPAKRAFISGDYFIRRCISKCSLFTWSRTCATHARKLTTSHRIKMHNQLGNLYNKNFVDNPCLCSNKTGLNMHNTALFTTWGTSSTLVNLREFFSFKMASDIPFWFDTWRSNKKNFPFFVISSMFKYTDVIQTHQLLTEKRQITEYRCQSVKELQLLYVSVLCNNGDNNENILSVLTKEI